MDTLLPLALTLVQVTVYPQGALYRYAGVLSVRKGLNSFVWEGLPLGTNPQSVRVNIAASAKGYITQTSVEPLAAPQIPLPAEVERLRLRIDSLESILTKVQQRLTVLSLQEKTIAENLHLGGEEGSTSPEAVERYLTMIERRLTQILEEKTPLEKRQAMLSDTLAHWRQLYKSRIEGLRQKRAALAITYWAPQTEVLPISVELSGPPASWELFYRIRALPAEGKIIFQRWAAVQNRSGEDWERIHLLLSTGMPERFGEMPPFQPWELDIRAQTFSREAKAAPLMLLQAESMPDTATESAEETTAPPIPIQSEQTLTRTYDLGQQSIRAGQQKAQFFLRADTLPASFRFFINAPAEESAFLRAALPSSALGLWEAAPATIEADGQEVGRIFWSPTYSEDTLWLDLGRSPFIQIKRVSLPSRRETRLTGGTVHHYFAYKLRLTHTYTIPIQVVLWDRVPVSRHADIKVEITDSAGAAYDPEKGQLTWRITLEPGESWERTFRFVVKYPKQKVIVGL
ncbi:MAG: DUF4139 domain-containing protein [Bacteroidia bacterium]|nr:DUF4139 domain-containing protein [Bacteroidia bacterium]MDW8058256.1 DUF4139 domain-containing protein [Bacteroidia bacterium]